MEKTEIAKYTMKDSVFTNLFQEKRYIIQLYRALHPEDTETTENELKDITIKNILVDACYNDLGFMVGDKIMILTEAQSTWTMNIIIRSLLYLAQSYHEYFERTSQSLYKSTKVKMPKPELYIIYTGNRGRKPDTISLSKEFFDGADIDIEVKAKVIYESETEDIINQYIIFCKVFDEQRKLYGMTEQTVRETIRICKDRNVLKEYLMNREMEVVTIMMSLFNDEQIMKTYWKDMENTLTDKITHDKDRETAERMIKDGELSLEKIARYIPSLSMDELKELEAKIMQLA